MPGATQVQSGVGLTFRQPAEEIFWQQLGEKGMAPGDGHSPIAVARFALLVDDDTVDTVLLHEKSESVIPSWGWSLTFFSPCAIASPERPVDAGVSDAETTR